MNKNKISLWSFALVVLLLFSTTLPVQAGKCPKLAKKYNVNIFPTSGAAFTPEVGALTYFLQPLGGNRYEVTSLGKKLFDLTQNCSTVQFLYSVSNATSGDVAFDVNWNCTGQIRGKGRKITGACRDEALRVSGSNVDFTFKWESRSR